MNVSQKLTCQNTATHLVQVKSNTDVTVVDGVLRQTRSSNCEELNIDPEILRLSHTAAVLRTPAGAVIHFCSPIMDVGMFALRPFESQDEMLRDRMVTG